MKTRLLLPLAAVLTFTVLALYPRFGPRLLWSGFAVAVAFSLVTERRNRDYRSELTLWGDTVAKRPANASARIWSRALAGLITPAIGEKFDPQRHEAMFEAPVPGTIAGNIIQVMDNGFMLHDRLLRPAKVGVSSTPKRRSTKSARPLSSRRSPSSRRCCRWRSCPG